MDLVKIAGISWQHNGTMTFTALRMQEMMLKIAFSATVQGPDLVAPNASLPTSVLSSVISVLVGDNGNFGTIWEEMSIRLFPGNFATLGDLNSSFTPLPNLTTAGQPNPVNGVLLELPGRIMETILKTKDANKTIRICVKGDFIRDTTADEHALDGNHLPPWLPKRPTGDGVEGGTFESWFTLAEQ